MYPKCRGARTLMTTIVTILVTALIILQLNKMLYNSVFIKIRARHVEYIIESRIDGMCHLTFSITYSSNISTDSAEVKLDFLRNSIEPWSEVRKAWEESILSRIEFSKINKSPLWQFKELICLRDARGPELIDFDFKLKFPHFSTSCKENWVQVQSSFQKFIESKNISGGEIDVLLNALDLSNEDKKDGPIFMLLPTAIKAVNLRPGQTRTSSQSNKRRKLEPEESKSEKKRIRETFIAHFDNETACDNYFAEKLEIASSTNEISPPVLIIVGPLINPEAYFTIFGLARYKAESLLEALELAFKIFFFTNLPYPKETQPLWLLLQRVVLKIAVRGEKLSTLINEVISFIENSSAVRFD